MHASTPEFVTGIQGHFIATCTYDYHNDENNNDDDDDDDDNLSYFYQHSQNTEEEDYGEEEQQQRRRRNYYRTSNAEVERKEDPKRFFSQLARGREPIKEMFVIYYKKDKKNQEYK